MKYVSTADDKLARTHKAEGSQELSDPLAVFNVHQTGDNMSTALPVPSDDRQHGQGGESFDGEDIGEQKGSVSTYPNE